MRILIAEDERITRVTLTRHLESWRHTVTAAEDGQEAWERFQAGGFDVVITDWEMPRLSGIELVQRIRQSPASAYVYVIILTSRSNKSDIVSGIETGADDFVSKPFDREELRVRLLAGERIINLERALSRQNAELRDANERIHAGLRAAARVQRTMLPRRNIVTPHVCTAWHYVPTEELAGDSIGLHLVDDRYLIAYILDVSGHGVPAALLAVSAMHALDPMCGNASLLRDMTGSGELGTVQQPAQVATELNRRFMAHENDDRFMTMILCVLDTRTGLLHLSSAGHPPPFVLRGSESVALPDIGGLPIAMVAGAEYTQAAIQLAPGDRVFLFSDGLVEQFNASDAEQFGEDRVLSLLQRQHDTHPDALAMEVMASLTAWAAGRRFADDVSIAVFQWLE